VGRDRTRLTCGQERTRSCFASYTSAQRMKSRDRSTSPGRWQCDRSRRTAGRMRLQHRKRRQPVCRPLPGHSQQGIPSAAV